MSDSGLDISALPRKPPDVINFVRDLACLGQDTIFSFQDNKKHSLRSFVCLWTESTSFIFFPATMKDCDEKKCPIKIRLLLQRRTLLRLNQQFPDAEISLLIEDFQTQMFKNGPLYLQSQLRRAVDLAVSPDSFFSHQYRH
jgi:hypothetical protein